MKEKLKDVAGYSIPAVVAAVITTLLNWGIFVTFPQMVAYAAPRDSITRIEAQLVRIEQKVDKVLEERI